MSRFSETFGMSLNNSERNVPRSVAAPFCLHQQHMAVYDISSWDGLQITGGRRPKGTVIHRIRVWETSPPGPANSGRPQPLACNTSAPTEGGETPRHTSGKSTTTTTATTKRFKPHQRPGGSIQSRYPPSLDQGINPICFIALILP